MESNFSAEEMLSAYLLPEDIDLVENSFPTSERELPEIEVLPAEVSVKKHEEPERLKLSEVPGVEEERDSVSYLGVKLPKGEGGPYTPDTKLFMGNVVTDWDLRLMQDVAVALDLNQPLLIEGGSGLGKTETVERMCAQLDRQCFVVSCNRFDPDDIIGKMTAREDTKSGFGWKDGLVLQAIRQGGVLFLDEYNFMRGDTRGRLHKVLDSVLRGDSNIILQENNGEVVPVHPEFRLIAAQNAPGGKFTDREVLDPAQLSRFVYLKLPDKVPTEVRIARGLGAIGKGEAPAIDRSEYLVSAPGFSMQQLREVAGLEDVVLRFIEFSESIEQMVEARELAEDQTQPLHFAHDRDRGRLFKFMSRYYSGSLNDTVQRGLKFYFEGQFESELDKEKVRELAAHVRHDEAQGTRRLPLAAARPAPTNTNFSAEFEKRGFGLLDELIRRGVNAEHEVKFIAGTESPTAWAVRERSPNQDAVLESLVGVNSAKAWEMRRSALDGVLVYPDEKVLRAVAISLGGIYSEQADQMRTELSQIVKREGLSPMVYAPSIVGIQGELAASLRKELFNSEKPGTAGTDKDMGSYASSLAGLETKASWRLRKELYRNDRYPRDLFALSLVGLSSQNAENYRERLFAANSREAVAISISGLNTARSWQWRERLGLTNSLRVVSLSGTLAGVDTQQAWNCREQALSAASYTSELTTVAKGLFGDHTLSAVKTARRMSNKP